MMYKIIPFICMLLGGIFVFVFGSPYYNVFVTNRNQLYMAVLTVTLLAISLLLKRNTTLHQYWSAAYALFIAACATLFLNSGILNIPYEGQDALQDIALDKVGQFFHVVPVILVFTLLAKNDLKSIFIAKGDLRQGLLFGLMSFVMFAIIGFIIQVREFQPSSLRISSIAFLLIFVFANAIMEELWFRGIFLKKYAPLIGRTGAMMITSIIFGASHINATYQFPGGRYIFGAVVFALGYAGADSMLKTDSLIGAVLFHAGYDLMIILPVINSMSQ